MYGVINNSLKEMIYEKFGEDKWQQVLSVSGVPDDSFLSMRSYDDALTYRLAMPLPKCWARQWTHA